MDTEAIFRKIKENFGESIEFSNQDNLLIHGDSLEMLKRIPDHSVSLILTDPPYHSTKKKI